MLDDFDGFQADNASLSLTYTPLTQLYTSFSASLSPRMETNDNGPLKHHTWVFVVSQVGDRIEAVLERAVPRVFSSYDDEESSNAAEH